MGKDLTVYRLCVELLRPVVRLLLQRGLKSQEMQDMLKHALVRAADEELAAVGQKVNVSRLSAATGLQRKDVKRLLDQPVPSPKLNLLAKVIGAWSSGHPEELELEEFHELVLSVSSDLNPGTVKFELSRYGAVEVSGEKIKLVSSSLQLGQGDDERALELLSSDIEDLTRCIGENVNQRPAIPNLHITTRFDNITVDSISELRKWCLEQGAALHQAARDKFSSADKDLNPSLYDKKGGGRISLSTFSITESAEREDEEV